MTDRQTFEMEADCPHCGRETPHLYKTDGHERDSSYDRRECLVCHWYAYGMSGYAHYSPPIEETSDG